MRSIVEHFLRGVSALGTAGNVPFLARAWSASGEQSSPIVGTIYGPVQGRIEERHLRVPGGLRYAGPPTGARRFLPPIPPAPRGGVAGRTELWCCFGFSRADNPTRRPTRLYSEDCVFLNVWTAGLDHGKRFR